VVRLFGRGLFIDLAFSTTSFDLSTVDIPELGDVEAFAVATVNSDLVQGPFSPTTQFQ